MRKWLREIRNCKGISQKTAAELAGISTSFYADIERGFRNPSPTTAQSIAEALGFEWTLFFIKKVLKTSTNKNTA